MAVISKSKLPTTEIIDVTPEIAEAMLSKNTKNRNVRQGDVTKLARQMSKGQWRMTGEPIKFDVAGRLIDGQHRLLAVVRSGATVPLMIVRGLPHDVQDVIDTGKTRTAGDMLSMREIPNSTAVAAAAKIAIVIEIYGTAVPLNKGTPISHSEILEWFEKYPEIVEYGSLGQRLSKGANSAPSVTVYTLWRLGQIDDQQAIQFWTDVAEKANLQRHDPCLTLAAKFSEIRRLRQVIPINDQLSMVYRAWNARRTGRTLTALRSAKEEVKPR